ncbi:calcium-binding protein [Pleurocapsa sp. PCC 7319]|uniref:calcium-binding protein n=1 Tax=Pleurocapsa sp. PCC 7319 TaxID=118161 RepID=UPI0003767165|nr:calcium-binding protein [Pleurocapsa sp. PCC 7319]
MSSIVSPDNTTSLQEVINPDGGFDVVGQQNEANLIEIRGDAPVGIVGGKEGDVVTTGAGDAAVFTGDGDDIINGGSGDDILRGGEGNDNIKGFVGDDFISGGEGDDVIRGGFGSDTLKGDAGDDIFEFAASEFEDGSLDEIKDFKAEGDADMIKIFDGTGEIGSVEYNDQTGIVSINGTEAIDIGSGQDITIDENDQGTWELF